MAAPQEEEDELFAELETHYLDYHDRIGTSSSAAPTAPATQRAALSVTVNDSKQAASHAPDAEPAVKKHQNGPAGQSELSELTYQEVKLVVAAQHTAGKHKCLSEVQAALAKLEDAVGQQQRVRQSVLNRALKAAARNAHPAACLAAVRLLLKVGAEAACQEYTMSALHHFLLTHRTGWTAGEHTDVVCALLAAGCSATAKSESGFTPLAQAATIPDAAAVQAVIATLLAAGAAVDATSSGGATPLHLAIFNSNAAGMLAAIDTLLAAGADPLAACEKGHTPVSFAVLTIQDAGIRSAAVQKLTGAVASQLNQAQTELEELKRLQQCIICMSEKRSIMFGACGHFALCKGCASACEECPVCRRPVDYRFSAYLS